MTLTKCSSNNNLQCRKKSSKYDSIKIRLFDTDVDRSVLAMNGVTKSQFETLNKKKKLLSHLSVWKSVARQYVDAGTPIIKPGMLRHLPDMLTIYEKVLADEISVVEKTIEQLVK
jgi:hypothetical protein